MAMAVFSVPRSALRHGFSVFLAPARRAATSSAPSRSSRLVAERIINMTAIGEDGMRHSIKGLTGYTLLKALISHGLKDYELHRLEDLSACCGRCKVSIASEWLDKLPPPVEEELDVLRASAVKGEVDKHARLGCQIVLQPDLEGMVVAVLDQGPGATP